MMLLLAVLACFGDAGPCADYCDYICECHEGEEGFDCTQCRTEYSDADSELQDECETELTELRAKDEEEGVVCEEEPIDTAAG